MSWSDEQDGRKRAILSSDKRLSADSEFLPPTDASQVVPGDECRLVLRGLEYECAPVQYLGPAPDVWLVAWKGEEWHLQNVGLGELRVPAHRVRPEPVKPDGIILPNPWAGEPNQYEPERRPGHSALRGRPLDDYGAVEVTRFDPNPTQPEPEPRLWTWDAILDLVASAAGWKADRFREEFGDDEFALNRFLESESEEEVPETPEPSSWDVRPVPAEDPGSVLQRLQKVIEAHGGLGGRPTLLHDILQVGNAADAEELRASVVTPLTADERAELMAYREAGLDKSRDRWLAEHGEPPGPRFGERLRAAKGFFGPFDLDGLARAIDADAEELRSGYRCFRCGETFAGETAAEHFGDPADVVDQPSCISTKHPMVQRLRARLAAATEERAALYAQVEAAVDRLRYTATRDDGRGERVALGREWDILDVKDLLAALAEIFGSAESALVTPAPQQDANLILRRLLWIRHGCPSTALYGDDGELSCAACGIDFLRTSPEQIEARWLADGYKSLIYKPPTEPAPSPDADAANLRGLLERCATDLRAAVEYAGRAERIPAAFRDRVEALLDDLRETLGVKP